MAEPTISITGANNGLFLINDNDGNAHRIPLTSVADVYDSSNEMVNRVEIKHARGEINLIFEASSSVTSLLTLIDSAY